MPDRQDSAEFRAYLDELGRLRRRERRRIPENVVVLERLESTNLLGRRIVAEYERESVDLKPVLILAREQTGGRGRRGRAWSSPPGKGVYATFVLPLDSVELLQTLPLLVGIGLCRGLEQHLSVPCRLEWPNDLLAGGRKIGGILIESVVSAEATAPVAAIAGFGVNHGHLAEDLPGPGATSLRLEGVRSLSLETLTWDLVTAVETELGRADEPAYAIDAYRRYSAHAPGERLRCIVGEEEVEGIFLGFDERGRLRLDVNGREELLAAGEVVER